MGGIDLHVSDEGSYLSPCAPLQTSISVPVQTGGPDAGHRVYSGPPGVAEGRGAACPLKFKMRGVRQEGVGSS